MARLLNNKIKKKVHRPYLKADKLGRICSIYWGDSDSFDTPEEFKETLNMFKGRQLKSNLVDCLAYLKLSLLKQSGDLNAEKEMSHLHRQWNEKARFNTTL